MKVRYIGPAMDGVYVPAADVDCKPGETIEVDAELGASLLEQPANWEPVAAPKSKTTTTAEEG